MDIDVLGRTSNAEADLVAQVQDVVVMDKERDGLDSLSRRKADDWFKSQGRDTPRGRPDVAVYSRK